MKNQLLFIIPLIACLLTNCAGKKKLSTPIPSGEINPVTEEVQSKTLNDSIVIDIDGHTYPVVVIGDKLWMAANLNVSYYNNGKAITPFSGGGFLKSEAVGKFVLYENDKANGEKYGKLYNHYAVQEGCLCPEGWQVPSVEDWQELIATNEVYKLNLLFGGFMTPKEISPFSDLDIAGYWWTTTSVGRNTAAYFSIQAESRELKRGGANETNFYSVRCVKSE